MKLDENGAMAFNNEKVASQWGSLMDFLGDETNSSFPKIDPSTEVKKETEDTDASILDKKSDNHETKYATGGFKTKFTLGKMRNRYGGHELYSNPTIISNLQLI